MSDEIRHQIAAIRAAVKVALEYNAVVIGTPVAALVELIKCYDVAQSAHSRGSCACHDCTTASAEWELVTNLTEERTFRRRR